MRHCQIPIADGFAAIQAIRKKYGPQQLPIIAITANISDIVQKHSLAAGMNDFLPKPVNKGNLQAGLRYWLAQRITPENL
ncbi:response regulator [Dasania marina]|uniref:response regulator n=1 Tax=Dasania marina TaxID=471499 RepID=UPI0003728516|nr:response regulator [Dasania marina]